MTMPALPPQGSNNWYSHYTAMDGVARTAVAGTGVTAVVQITQTNYTALATKDPTTLYVVTPDPGLAGLKDNFATKDTTKWVWGAAASVVAGQLQCVANSSYTGSITSVNSYPLTGSYAYINVPQRAGPGNGSVDTSLIVQLDASNNIKFVLEAANLYCRYTVAGVETTAATLTYSATTHAWWRIREASGTTYWDTSVDGTTWTQQGSHANPFAVTAVKVTIQSGYYGTETTPGTAIFDNFNTLS